jgi:hypothetical protein
MPFLKYFPTLDGHSNYFAKMLQLAPRTFAALLHQLASEQLHFH